MRKTPAAAEALKRVHLQAAVGAFDRAET